MGLREEGRLQTADSLHSTHPVGPRCVLSIHILIEVCPFGKLSVRKRVTDFPSSFIFIFGRKQ